MVPVSQLLLITFLYFALLFCVAYWGDRRREAGRSLTRNPYVYTLSLAVYMTSWTFYGSVGRAATQGLDFLPVYLGPTLIIFTWGFLLRKIVRVTREQNIVSIADFISSRYGKSASLGAIVTIFAVFGIMPYIALQLKAVSQTFDLLSGNTLTPTAVHLREVTRLPIPVDTALLVALTLGIFGVLFGARHLDTSERHEGLVTAIAFESMVKLGAFVAAGIFVTYGMFDGFTDIFARFYATFPERSNLLLFDTRQTPYVTWFTLTFISMMAFMLLPRQFHIMVIENSDEKHIRKAMWQFPGYMFLINLFVIPIALGGLLYYHGDASGADYYLLHLPLDTGHTWLSILVFIGGFSASAGMVMVSSVALATMVLNHLIIPLLLRFWKDLPDVSGLLINLKRAAIVGVILLGYLYFRVIGESYALVNIGLISFIAATQFAPAMIGGLYWRRATRRGATVGLMLGFLVWTVTLLIPSFVRSGWLSESLLSDGLFGLRFLRPLELFGLSGFDIWSHALFWTLFFNIGAYILLSILGQPDEIEAEQAAKFVDVFTPFRGEVSRKRISKAPTIMEFVDLMAKFIGEKQAHSAISEYIKDREIDERGSLSEYELPSLKRFTERTLAGSVGAAPARIIIENYLAARGSEMEDVFDIFGSVTISHTSSREQLGVLFEAAHTVSSHSDCQQAFDNILELLQRQFKFDLCVIRMLDPESNTLTVRSRKGIVSEHFGNAERDLDMETYIGECFLTVTPKVVNDTDYMERPKLSRVIQQEGIKSFAHAPIVIEGEAIGVLSAFSRSVKGIFTKEFIELFQSLAGQIGVAWRNAQQTQRLIDARSREREFEIAQNIQRSLIPTSFPTIPGVTLAGRCQPAKQVGGDYFDFLPREGDQFDLVIADVSGHDVGAALLMAETRTFIRSQAHHKATPSDLMDRVNRFFLNDLTHAELFITMFYVSYDTREHLLRYASAGHNRPLLWDNGYRVVTSLDADGLIFGVKENVRYEEKQRHLGGGDVLMLYTDGVTEAENSAGEFFGEERLMALLQEDHGLPVEELLETLFHQLRIFTGSTSFNDDVSVLILKVIDPRPDAHGAN